MPKSYWKEVLAPRTYLVPDEKGVRRKVRFSIADVQLVAGETKRMLDKGIPIPVPLNHQEYTPTKLSAAQKLADLVQYNSGEVEDQMLTPDNRLWQKVKITDDNIAKKIDEGSIKFVSPDIAPHVDCDGETFGPVVTHLALTPRPVWHGQTPFGTDAPVGFDAMLGKQGSLNFGFFDRLRLSMDQMEDEEEGDGPLTEEGEEKGEGAEKSEGGDGENGAAKPEQSKEALLAEVKQLLRENVGLNLPDDTDPNEFLEHLRVALHALKKPEEPGMNPDGTPGDLQEEQPQGGYAMGYRTAMGRVAALEGELADIHRTRQLQRIERLEKTGRMAPKDVRKLTGKVQTIKLSFDKAGKPQADESLDTILAYAEGLPLGAIYKPDERATRMSHDLEEIAPPNPDELKQSDVDKTVDTIVTENMGLRRKSRIPSSNGKN